MAPVDDSSSYPSNNSKKAVYILVGIKFVELCLIVCCIGLIDEPATHSLIRSFITPRVIALCYVTFGCLIIYTSIYLIMALFGDITPWRSATLWAFIGLILYVATTALLFRDWSSTKNLNYWQPNMQRLDLVLATASVSLVASIVFFIDILTTARFGLNGDLD